MRRTVIPHLKPILNTSKLKFEMQIKMKWYNLNTECSTVSANCYTETQIEMRDGTVEHFPGLLGVLEVRHEEYLLEVLNVSDLAGGLHPLESVRDGGIGAPLGKVVEALGGGLEEAHLDEEDADHGPRSALPSLVEMLSVMIPALDPDPESDFLHFLESAPLLQLAVI